MKTTTNNNNNNLHIPTFAEVIAHNEKVLNVCNKEIEYLTHPKEYGCCLSRCNRIVINKERMMTVTTDKEHRTTYEFSPLYPTYFSREAADEIVANDIYRDINGNRIELTIIGKLEYYTMLKEKAEKAIELFKSLEAEQN
jgi:hypothetical protein